MIIKDKPTCNSCEQPMQLIKRFENVRLKKKYQKMRVRRFRCDLCNLEKTIFAGGHMDENPELYLEENNQQ